MNIGQGIFPILTPQQANPGISAYGKIIAAKLQNQGQDLQNQAARAQMPYVGPQAAADLQAKQLANQWYAPEKKAQIDLQNAQTIGSQLASQIARLKMPYAAPQAAADVDYTKAQTQSLLNPGPSAAGGQLGYADQALIQEVGRINPNLTKDQLADAKAAYLDGKTTLPDGTPITAPNGTINEWANPLLLRQNTTKENNQINQGSALQTTIQEADKVAQGAFSYAGGKGQLKLKEDQALAAAGQPVPKEYGDYMKMTSVIIPTMMTQLINTEGGNSTDNQKILAQLQTNPVVLASNPQMAMDTYNTLKTMLGNISKENAKSFTEKKSQLASANSDYGSKSNNDYSDAPAPAIAALMKAHGITQEEAQAVLGGG